MEQNKSRYELILGFVTLIISFSAFKDELKAININLGFYKLTLADYLLKIVYGFGFCLYLYIVERIARQSKRLNSWRIIDYLEKTAFIIFVFIVLSPLILGLAHLVYLAADNFTKLDKSQKANLTTIFSIVLGVISGVFSSWTTAKYFKAKNKFRQDDIEKEEIIELENALRLFDNNFYSQSILEAFKVLEIHLIKLFAKKHINIPRHQFNFNELFNYAIKLELLSKYDIERVNEIRHMRNTAAHLNVAHTKQEAIKAIEFIKYLIQKTSDDEIQAS